jgi:large subunit ribosomal protein L17
MRHRKSGIKIGRTTSHRQAMFRNMVTSLFKYDRIRTTDTKAKELRSWADHMITLAKRGDLHARRQAMKIIREKEVVHKLFDEAAERFGSTSGGYTRIVKLGRRKGDAALISLIELIGPEKSKVKKAPKAETAVSSTPEKKEKAAEASESEKEAKTSEPGEKIKEEDTEPEKSAKTVETEPKSDNAEDEKTDGGELKEKTSEPEEKISDDKEMEK